MSGQEASTSGGDKKATESSAGCIDSIVGVWRKFVGVVDTDDFAMSTRKTWIALNALFSITGLMAFAVVVDNKSSKGLVAMMIAFAVTFLISGFPFHFWCLKQGTVSNVVMLVHSFAVESVLVLSSLTTSGPHQAVITVCVSVMMAACGTYLQPLWVVVNTLVMTLNVYNACSNNAATMMRGQTPMDGRFFIVCFVLLFGMTFFFHRLMAEYTEAVEREAANSRRTVQAALVSRSVSAALASYDTDTVQTLLDEYAAHPDVDHELCKELRKVAFNLNRYRPHLPLYLLDAPKDQDEEEGVTREPDGGRDSQSESGEARHGATAPLTPKKKKGSSDKGDSQVVAMSGRSKASVRGTPLLAVDHAVVPFWGNASLLHMHVDFSNAGGASQPSSTSSSQTDIAAMDTTAVTPSAAKQPPPHFAVAHMEIVHHMVTQIHRLAHDHDASLHSFVGDQLVASWNATRRVGQLETKACRFALQTTEAVRVLPGRPATTRCWIATGPVGAVFAGDEKHRTFWLHSSFHDRMRQLESIACQGGPETQSLPSLIILDSSTAANAKFGVELRGIDVTTDRATGKRQVAFEAVQEHVDAGSSEWMYVVEKNASGPSGTITRACEAFLADRRMEAIEILGNLEKEHPLPPTAKRLRALCE